MTSMALVLSLKTLAVLAVLLQVYKVHTSCQDLSYSCRCTPVQAPSTHRADGRRSFEMNNGRYHF